jgi:hypothetical protein
MTDENKGPEGEGNLTAHAGGGQKDATPIGVGNNIFTTVAKAGDSAILPKPAEGEIVSVENTTKTSMDVFPSIGHTINSLGINVPVAVAGGTTTHFKGTSPTNWKTK